jgi:hypothetical protein
LKKPVRLKRRAGFLSLGVIQESAFEACDYTETMLLALLAIGALADWVPARWSSSDPATLELVRSTPINCLVIESDRWSSDFTGAARKSGIAVLGVVRPGQDLAELPQKAAGVGLDGILIEGDFDESRLRTMRAALADSKLAVVELSPRIKMPLDGSPPVIGTYQGVWPGINETADDGSAKAAPSGAPWIDTNSGFLRFLHATTPSLVWMGHVPKKGSTYPVARYLQAIGDSAILGARWILALDEAFEKRLLSGDPKARQDWAAIAAHLRYFEEHKEWRQFTPYAHLAMVQDIETGGLYSGSVLDMIGVKHTPVLPVPARQLTESRLKGKQLAVNVDPGALTEAQKEVLRQFTRSGGMLLNAAATWKFPSQRADQMTLDKDSVEMLDRIYKEVNSLTGRRNLGARLFNVSSMISNLLVGPGGKPVILHLVNYSDYPIENITAHVIGKWSTAQLLEPGRTPRKLAVYEHEEGTGVEIDKVSSLATLVLE